MKSCLQILFVFLLTINILYPQWTNQNPVPNGNHLQSVFFIDDNTGWIIGSGGFIKKTTNAGLDWVQQNSGSSLKLRSVQFINLNTGWICGEGGLILKSTDSGQSWYELTSGTTEILTNLKFLDSDIGYAVGSAGTILKTTDGGLNWSSQSSGTTSNLFSVDFVDTLVGYAVGSGGRFLKTTDGGFNWMSKTLSMSGTRTLNCVEFIDSSVGWVGFGYDYLSSNIIKTTDGGETWIISFSKQISAQNKTAHLSQNDYISLETGVGIHSIYFKDSSNGYAVGGTLDGWNRCILSTTNAGVTWQYKYGDDEQTGLLSVFIGSSEKGWAVGFYGVIYITENNGYSWYQILSGIPDYWTGDWISSVFMINDSVGWAGGFRKGSYYNPIILKTTNGGKIWKTNSQFSNAYEIRDSKIYFFNENIGWLSFKYSYTFKTTNGGANWFSSGGSFDDMFFINQDTGWNAFVGEIGHIGVDKTTDGGVNWVQKSSVSTASVFFSNLNNGWAVGAGGSILKSTDSGESWVPKTSGTTSNLNLVRFYDSNVGVCVGSSGVVLLSTDGGENWIIKSGPNLYSGTFINSTTIWGSSAGGTVYKTTDFGDYWSTLNTGIGGTNSFFISEYMGWVTSGGNSIYKYYEEPVPIPLPVWTNQIYVEDAAGTESSKILTFGQHIDATDSIDALLCEYELPPIPPTGILDARFNFPTSPVVSSLKDYRDSAKTEIIWTMTFQPGSAGYPMIFSWDSTSFPEGTFYLKDRINGSYVFVNMKKQSSYTLTDPTIISLDIVFKGIFSIVSVNNEWNMISVPLLTEEMSLSNLFPTATSLAYGFDGSYVTEDTLAGGKGYWLKFDGNQQIQVCGSDLGETVPIEIGWNMFGAYEEDIPISQITTTPPEIIATYFFGFNDGYFIVDTLNSGQGYWVRVTQDGVLNLNSGGLLKDGEQEQFAEIDKNWGKIKITDNKGKSTTLYASEEEIESNFSELPPMPPTGIFDARYSSGKLIENLSSEKTVLISSNNYPITIRAEGLNITIRDMVNGELLNEELKCGEEIRIVNNKITSIVVSGRITGGLPISYELFQNYPNPFNPSTKIKFAVPKGSNVNLSIYNILGEMVATLVNEEMKPGYYEYEFNASNFASGVYLFRIKAGDFLQTKKMVLLK